MRPNILVVDDEPTVRTLLMEVLALEPYDVRCATTAAEALEMLERRPADVVVSDEKMPGMSGSEFLAIVRRRFPGTVRIILTGHATLDSAIVAINKGEIFRFLTKPCNAAQLRETIREALQHHRDLNRQATSAPKPPPRPGDTKARSDASECQDDDLSLETLERKCPGITKIKRDDGGAVLIE
jgi:two-component system probable response regulator PhcQ